MLLGIDSLAVESVATESATASTGDVDLTPIQTAIINGVTNTTTGNQIFTSTGFGTAQAARVVISRANSTNNPEASAWFSLGFTDGATDVFSCFTSEDGVNPTQSVGKIGSGLVAGLYTGVLAARLEISFSAWATDGITLSIDTNALGEAYNIQITLYKGFINVKALSYAMSTTGVNTVSGVGFKPNYGQMSSIGDAASSIYTGRYAVGVFHNSSTDTVTQACQTMSFNDAISSSFLYSAVYNDCAVADAGNSSPAWKGAIENVGADGFDINTGADNPGTDVVIGLLFKTNDADDVNVQIVDSPTATGDWSVTTGFKPAHGELLLNAVAAVGAYETDDDAGVWGLGAFNTASESFIGTSEDDGASPSNTQSNSNSTNAVDLVKYNAGFTSFAQGAYSTRNGTSYTLNFPTTVDSTARKWISVAFKDTSVISYNIDIKLPPILLNMIMGVEGFVGYTLSVDSLQQSQQLDGDAIVQHNVLSVNNANQLQSVGEMLLTQHHVVPVDDISQSQSIDVGALISSGVLSVDKLAHVQMIGDAMLTQNNSVVVNDVDQPQSIDAVGLATAGVLNPDASAHAQSIAAAEITEHNALSVNGSAQSQTLDSPQTFSKYLIAVAEISQSQSINALDLIEHNALSVDEFSQSQFHDAVIMTKTDSILIDELMQVQQLDSFDLQVSLLVAGLSQVQNINQVLLSQHNVLIVDDIVHSQLLSGISVELSIGWLKGSLVMVNVLDGSIQISPVLDGSVTLN